MLGKTFCVGDVHGNHKGLLQVLERSGFDYENDMLITLGDIVDGLPDSFECVEELLKIKNRIDIIGNHDYVFYKWLMGLGHEFMWSQGGLATARSYAKNHNIDLHVNTTYERDSFDRPQPRHILNLFPVIIREKHRKFFHKQIKFYVDEENRGFVHAGYLNPNGLGNDDPYTYMWTRTLWYSHAMITSQNPPKLLGAHKEIFIGHTQTLNWDTTEPMCRHNVINLDTGAGVPNGKLTIMDVNTKEFWQSDLTKELYPDYRLTK